MSDITTVGEMTALLSLYHPDEKLIFHSEGGRNYHATGMDAELTRANGGITISLVQNEQNKPVESVRDALMRQKKAIEEAIAKADENALKKATRTVTKKEVKNRTHEEQIAAGFIPTGKRGRPRKMRTVEDFRSEGYLNTINDFMKPTEIMTPQQKSTTYEEDE